jgi:hypothetical protein
MCALTTNGYDVAQASREDDDLDRWRLATEVVEVVLATPPDWSARIGIFGKWGEGKSTVLRFAEQMLRDKKSIVFWFNPWAIQNWNDLWEEFGGRLSEALATAGIPFDSALKKIAKDSTKWLETRGVGEIAKVGAAALGKDKVADAAFGLVSRWLKYDGPQIRAIQKKVKQGRLVVLIDDLDRCSPQLLPQLLLALRELLDLPGFTFLLAFDDEIVGRALKEENPAWLEGSNFLEKILDFRFHLPSITEKQKQRLVSRAMGKYCAFVPQESVQKIQDLLPNNPRKLKTLIRSLAALKPQIARHDPDELNWVDMWLAQMIRLESYPFFERLLSGDTLDRETGILYKLLQAEPLSQRGNDSEGKNQSLKQLIRDCGVVDPVLEERLIRLIEASRSRSSHRFQYVCELAVRPHAITWKEFRSFYATWTGDKRPAVLAKWIQLHAAARGVGIDDVESELFETILVRRKDCLSAASESSLIQEQESHAAEADTLLTLIAQYLRDLGKLDAPRFRVLYAQLAGWIAFRRNPRDKILRDHEESQLLGLVSFASPALSLELFEVVNPEAPHPDLGEGYLERQKLRERCMAEIGHKAASEAIAFMNRQGGIQSLTERGRFLAVKYCLFHPDSPVWKTGLRAELLKSICRGREEFLIYENVREYFDLLVQGLDHRLEFALRQDIAQILADTEFVTCLWSIVISRAIQYRMLISFVRARRTLIQNGVPEGSLPLTEDMQSRIKEDKTLVSSQTEEASLEGGNLPNDS